MKKKLLIFAGSFLLTLSVAQAQQDSTRSNTGSQGATGSTPTTTSPTQPPSQQGQTQYRTENMTEVQHNQLPSSLRETLRGSQYEGWENSTIYRDPTTGEYLLEMNSSSTATGTPLTGGTQQQPVYHRFDRNGKAIKQNNSGGGLDDN